MATFRRRATGWQAIIRVKGYPQRSKGHFRTKAAAREWATREEAEMRSGVWRDRTRAEQVTLAELLDRYNNEISPRKKGCEAERLRIKQLKQRPLAGRIVATIRPEDISAYITQRLAEGRKGSTINRELNLLHHLFEIARKRWGIAIANPAGDVERPKESQPRDRRLQPGEEAKLLAAARAARNPWVEPMVVLALETAMRRGELLSMRWADIDWSGRYVRLRDTKNGTRRDVPLSPRALDVLRTLPRSVGGRVIPLSLNAWRCTWRRTRKRAGLPDFRFHDLRHEATSRFFEGGLGGMEVAAITGHKDLRMLARYTHPRASDLARKLMESQGAAWTG